MRWRREGFILRSECGRWVITSVRRGQCVLHRLGPDDRVLMVRDYPSLREAAWAAWAWEAERRAG